ncbi:Bug family tripartite tricarboxylate transporter substrate binding protein [Caryophanon tenue]|uniref:ABC transporter substrate-binding protein n=1 Tax=Caryophanon tenue TaxID=33978 RepID=A0A1C0YCB2_9BACL|nr:tripartite tricarboxylate transporter substrate binding protein [Caryophanon tenue]OCS84773.1 hypothetical protein A6M13_04115 [Caryophanon tenue]
MKKFMLTCVLLMALVLAACSGETAQSSDTDYPERPIEIIVPFAPGGSTDIGGRILEKYLPQYLPEAQFVIVNKPGGSGTIALSDLYASKPDGYTLALTTHRALALQPLYGTTKYNHESFLPIAKVFGNQQILVVKADAPWQTFEEWLAYVKENPNEFTFGVSGGIGSGSHLPMAELELQAGIKVKAVPFEGTPPAITAILGGHVQGAILQPSDAKPLIESGELRAIFNAGSVPVPYFPEIPLLIDKGFDIAYDSNTSLIAPADLPEGIRVKLQEALKKTMEDPEVIAEFEKASLQVQYGTAEEVQKELDAENEKAAVILKELELID